MSSDIVRGWFILACGLVAGSIIGCNSSSVCERPRALTDTALETPPVTFLPGSMPPPAPRPAEFKSRAELFEALQENHRRIAVKEYAHSCLITSDPDYKRHADLTAQAVADVRRNGPHVVGTRTWALDGRGQLLFVHGRVVGGQQPPPETKP